MKSPGNSEGRSEGEGLMAVGGGRAERAERRLRRHTEAQRSFSPVKPGDAGVST